MAVVDQVVNENYALYNGDCCEVMNSLPDESIHLSIYSPPFCGLYNYSSSERDLSNCKDKDEFFDHYRYVIKELFRITLPGRCTAVHCCDFNRKGAKFGGGLMDFPGDVIREHEKLGFHYFARYHVWKEPLRVRNQTMMRGLSHRQTTEDSTLCDVASADYLLLFRKRGENPEPVKHECGFTSYAGSRSIPSDLISYRGHKGKQTENRYSHWIWRQYASSFWDDVRNDRVLPHRESKEEQDERHVHPLHLDIIDRCCALWSNPGDKVFTPFMGVGSEVYGAVANGRKGIGVELKGSYYKQAVKNVADALEKREDQKSLF